MPLAVLLAWLVLLRRGHDPRKALLLSAGFAAGFAVILTEVLSLLTLVIPAPAVVAWAGLNLTLAGTLIPGGPGGRRASRRGPGAADLARRVHPGLAGGALLLWGAVLLLGGIGPSNTPDVMTYHLPRVMHWVQNGTVAFYPTWVARQLYMPPGAEYLLLQFVLLGSPGAVNLLQGFLLGVGALAASLVVQRLGGGSLPQTLGALLVLTLPMGLLQGMTAQNDLVLSVWLLGLTTLTWEVTGAERSRAEDWLGWGVFLGLAVLTKGTAYVYGIPIVLAVAFLPGRRRGSLGRTIPLLLVPLVLTAGHFVRVERAFGHPLGSRSVRNLYANGTADPRAVASNVLRNLTLQLNTPSRRVNRAMETAVERVHRWMGFSPEDPRTTWPGTSYRVTRTVPNQDRASNPLHLILLLVVLAGLAARARRAPPAHRLLGLGLVAGFVIFCAVLKWQPWHARLHLPLFVVGAPLVAARLEDVLGRKGGLLLGALLLVQGGVVLMVNQVQPVIGAGNVWTATRHERRFLKRSNVRGAYRRLAVFLRDRGCERIGLVWQETAYEYPLWAMLDAVTIRHVAPPGVPRRGFVAPEKSPSSRAASGVCLWVCRGRGRCEGLRGAGMRLDRFGPYSVWRPGEVDPPGSSDAGGSHRRPRIRSAASSRSPPLTRRSKSPTSPTERR